MGFSTSGGDWSRRRFLATSTAALAGLLTACGTDAGAPAATTGGDGFPVSLTGVKGTVEITSRPERVVASGYLRDTDIALGLGVVPVGVQKAALFPEGLAPWVLQKLGSARPELLDDKVTDYEQIASLAPDLILATDSYRLDDDYPRLSQIAPTVSYRTAIGSESWQDMTTYVAPALGRTAEAAALIAAVEQQIRDARRRNPGFEGKTFTFGPVQPDGTVFTISSTEDAAAGLLSQLGLVLSPTVTGLPQSGTANRSPVAAEQLGLLDADVLLLTFTSEESRAQLEAQPLFQALPAVQRGSYVALDFASAFAFAFPSVLSIPYGLEQTLPKLQAALGL